MSLSEKLLDIKNQTDALLTFANDTTGESDARLGEAVRRLASGYGGGGGKATKVGEIKWSIPLSETAFAETTPDTSTSRMILPAKLNEKILTFSPRIDLREVDVFVLSYSRFKPIYKTGNILPQMKVVMSVGETVCVASLPSTEYNFNGIFSEALPQNTYTSKSIYSDYAGVNKRTSSAQYCVASGYPQFASALVSAMETGATSAFGEGKFFLDSIKFNQPQVNIRANTGQCTVESMQDISTDSLIEYGVLAYAKPRSTEAYQLLCDALSNFDISYLESRI